MLENYELMKRCEFLTDLDLNYERQQCYLPAHTFYMNESGELHCFCLTHAIHCEQYFKLNRRYTILTPQEVLCYEVMQL